MNPVLERKKAPAVCWVYAEDAVESREERQGAAAERTAVWVL